MVMYFILYFNAYVLVYIVQKYLFLWCFLYKEIGVFFLSQGIYIYSYGAFL